jgi:hypothetical protein
MLQWVVPCSRNAIIKIAWVSQVQLVLCLHNFKCIFRGGLVVVVLKIRFRSQFSYFIIDEFTQQPKGQL